MGELKYPLLSALTGKAKPNMLSNADLAKIEAALGATVQQVAKAMTGTAQPGPATASTEEAPAEQKDLIEHFGENLLTEAAFGRIEKPNRLFGHAGFRRTTVEGVSYYVLSDSDKEKYLKSVENDG